VRFRASNTLCSEGTARIERMNAVVYCRVSTKEQVSNLSLSTQQTRCVDYCTQHGWHVLNVFRDEGESAKTVSRTQFQQMLAFVTAKKNSVSYVVVHDMSRFSRQMEDQVSVLAGLKNAGVQLRSVMENVDETAAGKLMRNIYGAFNQFDNDRKAERTKLGMQRAASVGRFPHQAPLGYMNVSSKSGANLIPDPERAPLVQKAFELYGSGAETKRGVLRTVNALGLVTPKGQKVSPQTFDRMLRNELYAGWICLPKWNLRERGVFEPLVSEDLFQRVQDILAGKRVSVTVHNRNNPDFPLRVFVSCGECGTPLTGAWATGRKKRYPYYRCRNSRCKAVNVRRENLESDFAALIYGLAPDRRCMRLFKEIVRQVWKQRQAASEAILRAAKGTLDELMERKNRLVEFLLDGRLDQQTYEEQAQRLNAEIQRAKERFAEADMECMDVEAVMEFAERLVERPKQLWLESSLEQKQRLQRVFFPDGLTYTADGFGTAPTNSLFNVFQMFSVEKASLASPTGFEPVLPP
jgi:site-specific DNA recombinase